MYISKIKLRNFKSFKGNYELDLKSGIDYFVGNNNCGKTSIFHAVQFITSRPSKEDFISKGILDEEEVAVELVLKGIKL